MAAAAALAGVSVSPACADLLRQPALPPLRLRRSRPISARLRLPVVAAAGGDARRAAGEPRQASELPALAVGAGAAATALQAFAVAAPALAEIVGLETAEFPLIRVLADYVAVFGFYLVIGPLATYQFVRKRYLKKSKFETGFMFFCVFFFFPGMLLFSPFMNLRPDPRDNGRML
eukprot:jgi/Chlat1/8212/Chrsp76S07645